jgi:hypothetical protein
MGDTNAERAESSQPRANLSELRSARLAALRTAALPMWPEPTSPLAIFEVLDRSRHDEH